MEKVKLTVKQDRLLHLIGQGLSNDEAATVLGVTPVAVRKASKRLRELFHVDATRRLIPIAHQYDKEEQ